MIHLDLLWTSNNLQGIFTYILMKSHIILLIDFWKVLVAYLWSLINKAWNNQQQSSQNIYYTQILCYIIWANSWCIYCLILRYIYFHIHSPMETQQWTELAHCCFQAASIPTQKISYTADNSRNFAKSNTPYLLVLNMTNGHRCVIYIYYLSIQGTWFFHTRCVSILQFTRD